MVLSQALIHLSLSLMTQPDFDAVAFELVTEFGGAGTYTTQAQGSYDPSTGSVVVTQTPVTVQLVLVDLTMNTSGLSTKYNTQILAGDKEAYMIPPQKLGGDPLPQITPGQDLVKVGSITYTVLTFKEVNQTGTDPILYTLYLRR